MKAHASLPALSPDQLYRSCDIQSLDFETTDDLSSLPASHLQSRALEAIQFGVDMRHPGFNLFVLGSPGAGRRSMVMHYLSARAHKESPPDSWCYANNFADATKPIVLHLPHGKGEQLRDDMEQLVKELQITIPAMFEGEEYRARVDKIDAEFNELQQKGFIDLANDAESQGMALMRTPEGFSFAVEKDGAVLTEGQYEALSQEEKAAYTQKMQAMQKKLEKLLQQVLDWRRAHRDRLRQLNREVTIFAVGHLVDDMINRYKAFPDTVDYLEAVKLDVIDNAQIFRNAELSSAHNEELPPLRRYQINVLVSDNQAAGAPIVLEENPTFQNLFGRVEHIPRFGNLFTDFLLIRPGALHRANGGYLIIDIHKLLSLPFAWEGLKRALTTKEIRLESVMQMVGMVSTLTLEPQAIPLNVKVILLGERIYYYLLQLYDPDFAKLFKVAADFEDDIARTHDSQHEYARLVAELAKAHILLPFDRSAVARLIEHAARDAGDAERLSLHLQQLSNLMHEADHWASRENKAVITDAHVQQAIDAWIRRSDRVKRQLFDAVLRGTIMIDTAGAHVGQVNGLSVLQTGDFAFGQPTRITATTRLGDGEVIDIQREVSLSGALHSKGVLILSSFLASRYSARQPLSLSASLVFEQTYGHIEGDSASMAELCALLSSLAEVPIKQSLAITGSVNQYGQSQAIGGVNEKIEGFFDLCAARGLTGDQGVLIPATNAKHLMLRNDVVKAAAAGQFHVYAVDNIDQAIEILTGIPAGEPDGIGDFAPDSINHRVRARLAELLQLRVSAATSVGRRRKRSHAHSQSSKNGG